jgi:S1-C subfamily serine protease
MNTGRIVLLAGVCAAFASCGDAPRSDADLAAAVRVEAHGCSDHPFAGGGSFVGDDRVLTVAHVVAGADEVEVVFADGSEHESTVVAIDRTKDLAVLHVQADVIPLRVGSMRSGQRGTFAAWRIDGFISTPFVAASSKQLNVDDIDHLGSGGRRGFVVDADIAPGDSGSVLVVDGAAVAVLFARSTTDRHRAYATAISEAVPLIRTDNDLPVDLGACTRP